MAPVGAVIAVAALYLAAARRARRWPPGRSAAFLAGCAVLAAALSPPLHARADELLSAHMAQHLLLTLAAPPLLLAGAPLTLAMRTLPRAHARALLRLRSLSRPAVGWAAFSAVLLATHVPVFYDAAVRHPALHALEHGLYLAAALLFWLPLTGLEPLSRGSPALARVLALLAAMPPMALVGLWLIDSGHGVYSVYGDAHADQRLAGELMWIGGSIPLGGAALAVAWTSMRREEERQRIREARA